MRKSEEHRSEVQGKEVDVAAKGPSERSWRLGTLLGLHVLSVLWL